MGMAVFSGCATEDDPFVDDHILNPGLAGTWLASGTYEVGGETFDWTDTYIITLVAGTIEHPEGYTWQSAKIVYVYNFNETSGCLIVEYTAGEANKYNAVYFKNLTDTSVLLGDAFTVETPALNPAVDTLDEAKTKFAPENASLYGGAEAQTGTPQIKQPTES
jgi:hypothetical protein